MQHDSSAGKHEGAGQGPCKRAKTESCGHPLYVNTAVNRTFRKVRTNRYTEGKPLRHEMWQCQCTSPCDEQCLNYALQYECTAKLCPFGTECGNQRLRRKQYAPYAITSTEGKGRGMIATSDISPGTLIVEYCGEVIGRSTFDERMHRMASDRSANYYFLALTSDLMIDAGPCGNDARFINHSCSPNCETEKWIVDGLDRVAIVARRDIPAGAEITYNYNFERYWDRIEQGQPCLCGASNCSGILGLPPKELSHKA